MGYDTKKERREIEKEIEREQKEIRDKELHADYLYTKLWPALFKRFSFYSITDKLILFASSSSSALTDNLRPVYNYLNKEGYDCVFIGKFEYDGLKIGRRKAEYNYYKNFFKYYARCKVLYLDDTFLPAYSQKPRKGQQIVQLWNTFGTIKKWDYAADDDKLSDPISTKRPIHNTYTSVAVCSDAAKTSFVEAFNCDESIVHAWGVPKTDYYFDKDFVSGARDNLIKAVPNLNSRINGRKILLYAPTYRGSSKRSTHFYKTLDFLLLKRLLGNDYVLLIKYHPLLSGEPIFSDYIKSVFDDFLFEVPSFLNVETALAGADMLITDYSSVAFEYSILERPMIFYAFDISRYKKEKEFFVKYEKFAPGDIVYDTLQLIEAVKKAETDFDLERVKHFRRKYMSGCDGHSTGRVVRFTVKGEESKRK